MGSVIGCMREDAFEKLPGCIPRPGFKPDHAIAYLNKATDELKSATDEQLSKWSEQVRARIEKEGLEAVLEDHIFDLMVISYVKPGFLEDQVESWYAASQNSPVPLDSMASDDDDDSPRQPREIYHRGFGFPSSSSDEGERVKLPGVVEADGEPVEIYCGQGFANWGDTVTNSPTYTCYPLSSAGVQNIVKHFIPLDARIRAAGSRHSWSDVYNTPATGSSPGVRPEVLVCTMSRDAALPSELGKLERNKREDTDLNAIELLMDGGSDATRVRLGGATTSEFFRRWALDKRKHRDAGQWKWMLRALPILVSITSPGWTQVICHGAGIQHESVSDLCVRMEVINCRGDRQIIDDREQLRAASGAFGFLGFIVSQDFIVDPLMHAKFAPKKRPVLLSVPPLHPTDVPASSPFRYADHTGEEYAAAEREFEEDAGRFYNEFFWFPLQKECWINCWDTDAPDGTYPQYPNKLQVLAENAQAALGRTIETRRFYKYIPPKLQTKLTAITAMAVLPDESDYERGESFIRSNVPDTLHFRRGIHRMPVRDTEISIQIPALPRSSPDEPLRPDLKVVRQAWWAGIAAVYDAIEDGKSEDEKYPMRTTLEMRLTAGSGVFLSSQYGNDFTCTIEVLTNTVVSDETWGDFINDIVRRWKTLPEVVERDLRVKFHWAKEWPTEVDGVNLKDYVRSNYAKETVLFKSAIEEIGAAAPNPYTLEDTLARFGNDTLIDLLGLSI